MAALTEPRIGVDDVAGPVRRTGSRYRAIFASRIATRRPATHDQKSQRTFTPRSTPFPIETKDFDMPNVAIPARTVAHQIRTKAHADRRRSRHVNDDQRPIVFGEKL